MFWLFITGALGASILGVSPKMQSLYQAEVFSCLDGSLDVPATFINDNFCDCTDGSDEPGTSACKNGQFYCAEDGYSPFTIPSSMVGDSICDCCDGSDEEPGKCPHNCKDKKMKSQENLRQKYTEWQQGLVAKLAVIAQASVNLQTKEYEIKKHKELREAGEKQKKAAWTVVKYLNEHQGCSEGSEEKFESIGNTMDEMVVSATNKIKDLEDELTYDVGKEKEFWNLIGLCTDYKEAKYTYTVCFYKDAVQKEGSSQFLIGRWNGFAEDYQKISFTGGDRCYSGPERSLTLTLECGPTVRLYGLEEPERCVYTAKLVVPGACKLDQY
ncbi:PRKCSH [Blepharisma stoltei]|uniref:Glucosidase 2 subunit beta n=1 Tax=Blepharisma stoltei TaxID=1481888 RepID=A0AAU9JA54_9CILI|nr:unnamed protein product [Blepharisma stoltei]